MFTFDGTCKRTFITDGKLILLPGTFSEFHIYLTEITEGYTHAHARPVGLNGATYGSKLEITLGDTSETSYTPKDKGMKAKYAHAKIYNLYPHYWENDSRLIKFNKQKRRLSSAPEKRKRLKMKQCIFAECMTLQLLICTACQPTPEEEIGKNQGDKVLEQAVNATAASTYAPEEAYAAPERSEPNFLNREKSETMYAADWRQEHLEIFVSETGVHFFHGHIKRTW